MDEKKNESKELYYQSWFVVLMLIIFPIAGLILAALNPYWSTGVKLAIYIIYLFLLLAGSIIWFTFAVI